MFILLDQVKVPIVLAQRLSLISSDKGISHKKWVLTHKNRG
jgi:hypothetical protein